MSRLARVSGDLPVVLELWVVEQIRGDCLFHRFLPDRREVAYLVCSRFIEQATLRAKVGERVLEFAHREHTEFDWQLLGLQTEPVAVIDLERFIADPKDTEARACTVDLTFNYYEILRLILRGMTGREGESLAQPSSSFSSLIESAMPRLDPTPTSSSSRRARRIATPSVSQQSWRA